MSILNIPISGTESETSEVYSTEEVKIGTWIDGKPLYRKVLEVDNVSSTAFSDVATLNALSIDSVAKIDSMLIGTTVKYCIPGGTYYTGPSAFQFSVTVQPDGNTVKLRILGDITKITPANLRCILEYTKTTD